LLQYSDFLNVSGGKTGGLPYAPDLYKWTAAVSKSPGVILDGRPDDGWIFLFVGALSFAQALLPRESTGFMAAVLVLALVTPVLCIGAPQALKWVRRRYLIERVGYVQNKPIGLKQILYGIVIVVLMALVLFVIAPRLSHPDAWLLAGAGLFGGALMAGRGRSLRFIIYGVLIAATGVLLAFIGVSSEVGNAIMFGLIGLVTLLSGSVVFLRFIRQPIETGVSDEH